jgi:glycosyltransferase involved in cell wall biosynthesis
MTPTPLVSIALIAGNGEGAILRRLIESARGLWDQVVVVAAVGNNTSDDLRQALQEAAGDASIFAEYHNAPENADWPHIDNFAAARNKAFDLATGKFVIWADCDDIFEEGQAALHRAQVEACAAGKDNWDLLVTLYDVQNSGMRNNKRERIFRRMPDGKLSAYWERQIHERVKPRDGAKLAVAEHLKILHAPTGPKTSSAERNKRIIASRLNGIGMEWYYLAQEHFLKNQYQEAIGPCLLALEHADVGATEKYQLHCQAFMMLAERAKRLDHIGKAIALSPMRREAHGLLATDRMDHGDFTTAYHILKQVDAMPSTQDWNQENRWYKHLPRQLMAQCLRALGQHEQANQLVRDGFRGAWGRITVIHAGQPDDCLKSMALYTDCADAPNGIQHLLLTQKGHKIADRLHIVQTAQEALQAALGDVILTVKAKDAVLPGLRWDAELLENGTVPPGAEKMPSPIDRNGKVRVCLTTTPKRIHTILPTLQSLLNQSRPADEICLSLPEKLARTGERMPDMTQLPTFLKKLVEEGRVSVHTVRDHGPATKFVGGAHHAEPDDFIIWCDDDILYSPKMVETLVDSCPEKSAIGLCGFFMTGPKGYAIAPDHLGHAEILEGFGAVCCRKKDLPDLTFWPSYTAKEFAKLDDKQRAEFLADDFMMSKRLRENGTATLVCNTPDFNRSNGIRIRPEGLGEDALQNNKQTGGNLAAYALLKG